MIFLSVSHFGFHCLYLRPCWITLKGPIFQNYLRDYVNEYGHFEFINKEERSMNMIVQI